MVGFREGRPGVAGGSVRQDTNAVELADPVALLVIGGVVDLTEAVFDAAGDGDQEQPWGWFTR